MSTEEPAEHPSDEEDCIDSTQLPFYKVEYLLSKSPKDKGKGVVYSRTWCFGCKCKRVKDEKWTPKRIESAKAYLEASLSYDMYEDIH